MTGGPFFPEAERVLRECARRAARGGSHVAPVAPSLQVAAARLREPLRLAVVGQIKRGKSTLVNALLGEDVAATGQLELTFTVSEFCYGDTRSIRVHNKDSSIEGPLPPDALKSLTARDDAYLDRLRKISKVEYAMPSELLRSFRLIDTPGLGSVYHDDARNSLDYLGLDIDEFAGAYTDEEEKAAARRVLAAMGRTASDVYADSARQAGEADAMIYLFSRGVGRADHETIRAFLGPAAGRATPLRAFAVLSRCDAYWSAIRDEPGSPDPVTYDPMAKAREIASRYLEEPGIGSMFATIVPVTGIVGMGARLLTATELGLLADLSAVEPRPLARALLDTGQFATAPELRRIPLPAPERARLITRLGNWGINQACRYLRDHVGEDELRDRLVADSGVTRLRELIISHFGNRAAIIKLDRSLQDAMAEIGRCRLSVQTEGRPDPPTLTDVASRVDRLLATEHGAAEVAALDAHYRGALRLTPAQVADLLTVTGERGPSRAARLGLPEDTAPGELVAAAACHAAAWSATCQDPLLDRATRAAARTIHRSYDLLRQRVCEWPTDEG
jgi:Dynamin family